MVRKLIRLGSMIHRLLLCVGRDVGGSLIQIVLASIRRFVRKSFKAKENNLTRNNRELWLLNKKN